MIGLSYVKERMAIRAEMITGLFQYAPCELSVGDGVLRYALDGAEGPAELKELSGATITRRENGTARLELTTRDGLFEFLLKGERAGDEAQSLLYELTKNEGRLELRLRGE